MADYWARREEKKQQAQEHNRMMEERYPEAIEKSVSTRKIYGPDRLPKISVSECGPKQMLVTEDTVSAVFKYKMGRTAVLNFASYKYPGGKYMDGSSAQEESLCHESTLYNVLQRNPDYYEWNRKNDNNHLYLNRAVYTQDIVFLRGSRKEKCDVITCAAPNYTAASKYKGINRKENERALEERISFIVDIAMQNKVDTLILGAFGCGVFGQDASTVAKIFQKHVERLPKTVTVVYAVPKTIDPNNYEKFARVFS